MTGNSEVSDWSAPAKATNHPPFLIHCNSFGPLLGFVPHEKRYAMRIYTRSILPVLLLTSVALWGANPFVGVWKMNPAKSKYTADHPAPKSLTATIREQPDGIVVDDAAGEDAKGNPIHAHYTAKFDGKDYPLSGAADADTVNIRRIDENTIESTRKKKGQVINTIRSVVSADGKTRTSTWSGKDSTGNPETWTVVLDKQ